MIMRVFRLATAALAAALGVAMPTSAQTLRLAAVDVSSLPVVTVVVDRESGTGPLDPVAFRLVEDDATTAAASRVRSLRETDMGLAIVVAVDASGSMRGRPIAAVKQGIASLAAHKRDRDRISVLSFADDIRWDAPWTASADDLAAAFTRLEARGRLTRLNDAVVAALDELEGQEKADSTFPRRHVVLLISDGHDEGSRQNYAALLERVRTSRVRLDAIGLAHSPVWLKNLQALARGGFGQFRTADSPQALVTLLETGIDDTLAAPVLEFTAEHLRGDGKTHRLGVRHVPSQWASSVAVALPDAGHGVDSSTTPRRFASLAALVGGVLVLGRLLVVLGARRRKPLSARPMVSPSQAMAVRVAPAAVTTEARLPSAPSPAVATTARQPTVLVPTGDEAHVPMSLTFASGPYTGRRFSLDHFDVWIGASAGNQICLDRDDAVSGHHARITREGAFYRLYDNGSLNHTWLNGQRVTDATLLHAGDRIRVGRSECTFEREAG